MQVTTVTTDKILPIFGSSPRVRWLATSVLLTVVFLLCLVMYHKPQTVEIVTTTGTSRSDVVYFGDEYTIKNGHDNSDVDVTAAHTVDDRLKKITEFTIEDLVPFHEDVDRCTGDGYCYENWMAMDFPPLNATWDRRYKNPCFFNNRRDMLQCFPHVHMVGWAKSGTTDMWYYFQKHPGFIHGWKETQWLTQFSFYFPLHKKMRPFLQILQNWFDERLDDVKKAPEKPMYDATATVIYDNWHWKIKQGYSGDDLEPTHTNFHYLRKIHPGAQIIVMMRNPTTRALSFYNHAIDMTRNDNANLKFKLQVDPQSPEDIHTFFVDSIYYFDACVKRASLRHCCHLPGWDSQDWGDPKKFMTLRIGIYYIFMEEIYKNFPPDQVNVQISEQFYTNTTNALNDVFSFLQVSTEHTEQMVKDKGDYIVMKIQKYFTPLPKTYKILQDFYKPFNDRLSYMFAQPEWAFHWASEVADIIGKL